MMATTQTIPVVRLRYTPPTGADRAILVIGRALVAWSERRNRRAWITAQQHAHQRALAARRMQHERTMLMQGGAGIR